MDRTPQEGTEDIPFPIEVKKALVRKAPVLLRSSVAAVLVGQFDHKKYCWQNPLRYEDLALCLDLGYL